MSRATRLSFQGWLAGTLLVAWLTGCAAQSTPPPPITLGPPPPGSIEYAKRELAGAWSLVSVEIRPQTPQARQLKASGSLLFNEFGRLRFNGQVYESLTSGLTPGILKYDGRVVIDPVKGEMYLLDLEGTGLSGSSVNDLAPSAVRRYTIEGNDLHITVLNERGEPTAVLLWTRSRGTGKTE